MRNPSPCRIKRWVSLRSTHPTGCCASLIASTPATRIEILRFQCSIALNDLCTSIQNAAQFRAAFLFCDRVAGRPADVGDFGWPYDLKPLEHGFDLVMHMKPLRGGPPPEEPAVGRQPPFTGALALTFIPGEPFIDRVQRSSPNLGRTPDRARTVGAVEQDDVAPDDRRRLSVGAELANQSRGSALVPATVSSASSVAISGPSPKATTS